MVNKKIFLAAAVTIVLDFIFHYFFTQPMETVFYFAAKFAVAALIFYFLFKKKFTWKRGMIFAGIFVVAFFMYYVVINYVQLAGYLGRTPDVILGSIHIVYTDYLKEGIVWTLVHGGAFLTGGWLFRK